MEANNNSNVFQNSGAKYAIEAFYGPIAEKKQELFTMLSNSGEEKPLVKLAVQDLENPIGYKVFVEIDAPYNQQYSYSLFSTGAFRKVKNWTKRADSWLGGGINSYSYGYINPCTVNRGTTSKVMELARGQLEEGIKEIRSKFEQLNSFSSASSIYDLLSTIIKIKNILDPAYEVLSQVALTYTTENDGLSQSMIDPVKGYLPINQECSKLKDQINTINLIGLLIILTQEKALVNKSDEVLLSKEAMNGMDFKGLTSLFITSLNLNSMIKRAKDVDFDLSKLSNGSINNLEEAKSCYKIKGALNNCIDGNQFNESDSIFKLAIKTLKSNVDEKIKFIDKNTKFYLFQSTIGKFIDSDVHDYSRLISSIKSCADSICKHKETLDLNGVKDLVTGEVIYGADHFITYLIHTNIQLKQMEKLMCEMVGIGFKACEEIFQNELPLKELCEQLILVEIYKKINQTIEFSFSIRESCINFLDSCKSGYLKNFECPTIESKKKEFPTYYDIASPYIDSIETSINFCKKEGTSHTKIIHSMSKIKSDMKSLEMIMEKNTSSLAISEFNNQKVQHEIITSTQNKGAIEKSELILKQKETCISDVPKLIGKLKDLKDSVKETECYIDTLGLEVVDGSFKKPIRFTFDNLLVSGTINVETPEQVVTIANAYDQYLKALDLLQQSAGRVSMIFTAIKEESPTPSSKPNLKRKS